jgi:hypothetical protein
MELGCSENKKFRAPNLDYQILGRGILMIKVYAVKKIL